MKKITNLNKLFLSTLVVASCITNLNATDKYVGLKLSKLDTDKTVFANISGNENIGPYKEYNDMSLVGIEMEWLHANESSAFLWGIGWDLMLNEGKLFDGGMLDLDLKLGGHWNNVKVYGILGYGIQSLSDYTASQGMNIGIGTTYDIKDNFAINASYTKHNMNTFTSSDNDKSDNQDYGLSGFSLGILYKY